jgi:preprotein translocase subunit YajC
MLDMLTAAAGQPAAPAWTGFLPIVGMVAIFWFLLIRPQMRQQK